MAQWDCVQGTRDGCGVCTTKSPGSTTTAVCPVGILDELDPEFGSRDQILVVHAGHRRRDTCYVLHRHQTRKSQTEDSIHTISLQVGTDDVSDIDGLGLYRCPCHCDGVKTEQTGSGRTISVRERESSSRVYEGGGCFGIVEVMAA